MWVEPILAVAEDEKAFKRMSRIDFYKSFESIQLLHLLMMIYNKIS